MGPEKGRRHRRHRSFRRRRRVRQPRGNGKAPLRTIDPELPPEKSAATRDALLVELAGFSAATEMVTWAQRTLRIRNT
jgi:hypothetical protein